MIEVNVDPEVCAAHGECAFLAPHLFELVAGCSVPVTDPTPEQVRAVRRAARRCPVQAITVTG